MKRQYEPNIGMESIAEPFFDSVGVMSKLQAGTAARAMTHASRWVEASRRKIWIA